MAGMQSTFPYDQPGNLHAPPGLVGENPLPMERPGEDLEKQSKKPPTTKNNL